MLTRSRSVRDAGRGPLLEGRYAGLGAGRAHNRDRVLKPGVVVEAAQDLSGGKPSAALASDARPPIKAPARSRSRAGRGSGDVWLREEVQRLLKGGQGALGAVGLCKEAGKVPEAYAFAAAIADFAVNGNGELESALGWFVPPGLCQHIGAVAQDLAFSAPVADFAQNAKRLVEGSLEKVVAAALA